MIFDHLQDELYNLVLTYFKYLVCICVSRHSSTDVDLVQSS